VLSIMMDNESEKQFKSRRKARRIRRRRSSTIVKTMKRGGAVIDSGGFGCILKPQVRCKKKSGDLPKNSLGITKMLKREHAEKEYTEIMRYKPILQKIPNYSKYFLIDDISICEPMRLDNSDLVDFDKKCSALKKLKISKSNVNKSLNQLRIINMPYGGIDVGETMKRHILNNDWRFLKTLNNKLLDLLENGVVAMNDRNIFHFDLKNGNILVSSKERTTHAEESDDGDDDDKHDKHNNDMIVRIIDWGLSAYYKPNDEIPSIMLNRPFQFNVPFSNVLFTDMFRDTYQQFLKHKTEDEMNYPVIHTFIIHYVLSWLKKRGSGHIQVINIILKELFVDDNTIKGERGVGVVVVKKDSKKNDDDLNIGHIDYTFYYIFDYLTKIVVEFTDKKKKRFEDVHYFNNVFKKNVDVWGLVMSYTPYLEYLCGIRNTKNKNGKCSKLSPIQENIVDGIRQLMTLLMANASTPISIGSIRDIVMNSINNNIEQDTFRNNNDSAKTKRESSITPFSSTSYLSTSDLGVSLLSTPSNNNNNNNNNIRVRKTNRRRLHNHVVKTLKRIKTQHSKNQWLQ